MIEALFAKTDEFRAQHDLDRPGSDRLYRIIAADFSDDAAGQEFLPVLMKNYLPPCGICIKNVLVEMK